MKAYELQSQKVEAGLVHEQATITAEIGRFDKAGIVLHKVSTKIAAGATQ